MQLSKRRKLDCEMKDALSAFMEQNARGMFLWVNLIFEELARRDQRLTDEAISFKLSTIPLSLKTIYTNILEANSPGRRRDLWQILRLLTCSRRSLSLDGLHMALCLENNISKWHDLVGDVKYLCGSLVDVTEDGEIHWIHQTAFDHVLAYARDATLEMLGSIDMRPPAVELHMANLCLDSMLYYDARGEFRDPMIGIWPCGVADYRVLMNRFFETRPFLEYAGRFWSDHANAHGAMDSSLVDRLELLFESRARLDMIMRLKSHFEHQGATGISSEASVLHFACLCALPDLTKRYLEHGIDPNAAAIMGDTPITWAAEVGAAGCVAALLAHGADLNAREGDEWTALHWAAANGHVEVVNLLLRAGAEISMESRSRQPTPLWWALSRGRWAAARVLADCYHESNLPEGSALREDLQQARAVLDTVAALDSGSKPVGSPFSGRTREEGGMRSHFKPPLVTVKQQRQELMVQNGVTSWGFFPWGAWSQNEEHTAS